MKKRKYIAIGLLLVLTVSFVGIPEVIAKSEQIGYNIDEDYAGKTDRDWSTSMKDPAKQENVTQPANATSTKIAGWRSSEYGYQFEAEPSYWVDTAKEMVGAFPGSQPGGIWIVGIDWSDGTCGLSFPRPATGGSYPNIEFNDVDKNERYLKAFDDAGLKVWLQVEPANANVDQLIDLVLDQYGHHPSVKGVGIDVEWLESKGYPEGRPVTNAEAERWINSVKSHNSNYKLFLKHWDIKWMPTEHYKDIVFISDGLDFTDLNSLVENFSNYWASNFPNSQVGFQIGYNIDANNDGKTDRDWWQSMNDPAKEIGTAIINRVQNVEGVYWVDFTIKEVFPPGPAKQENTLTFVVSSDDEPIRYANVKIGGIKIRTDKDGEAVFTKIGSGEHTYIVNKKGYYQDAGNISVNGDTMMLINLKKKGICLAT